MLRIMSPLRTVLRAGLFVTLTTLTLGLAASARAVDQPDFRPTPFNQPPVAVSPRAGEKAPGFMLKTVDAGQPRSLDSFAKAKGMKGAVVIFLSCRCPYVAQARAPIAELFKKYGDKVAFVGLNANQNEPVADIKADAALSFGFPMLRDEGSKVADLYGAQRTPEVFVVGPNSLIRYHGGVDDLGPALEQLVAGKAVTKFESKAFGCTIKRKP
jgi:peroxiredoxin